MESAHILHASSAVELLPGILIIYLEIKWSSIINRDWIIVPTGFENKDSELCWGLIS